MPDALPDTRVATPMVRQRWRSVSFVHWPYRVAAIRDLVPAPLELDTFDGDAWISLVLFDTTAEAAGLVPLPGARRFPETNLRTYVRAPDGSDGLWFLSLDVTNASNVLFGRLGFPYWWSDMTVEHAEHRVRYRGRRRVTLGRPAPSYDVVVDYDDGDLLEQDERDVFLTGRWHTYSKRGPLVARFDVQHAPWPLARGDALVRDRALVAAAHVPPPQSPPLTHYADGVDANIGVTRAAYGGSLLWRPTSKRDR